MVGTRTYAYGAKAPIQNAELVEQQFIMAHRFEMKLVAIERARRAVVDPIFRRLREAKKAGASEAVPTWEEALAVQAANWDAEEASRQVNTDPRDQPAWGTRGALAEAARQGRGKGNPPKFVPYDGTGVLSVQVQKGMSVAELESGTDTRVRLVPDPTALLGKGNAAKRKHLWLRIGSDGRRPVWAVFPVVYHREIPPMARVKWVRLVRFRVGTHDKYSAQFVLEGVPATLPKPTLGTIAVDIGWRRFSGDGLRIAAFRDDTGETGEWRLPEQLLARWGKCASLRSIRDTNFNEAVAHLRAARSTIQNTPEWWTRATASAHNWQPPGKRLGELVLRWRTSRFAGDDLIYDAMEAWRKQERHLHEWEANQRQNVLAARRERYRLIAIFLAKYRRVVFEKLDLRDFAELPLPTSEGLREDPVTTAARPRRFLAALSEFRAAVKDAVARAGGEFLELPARHTTTTCHACGAVEAFDAARVLVRTCPACGAVWDQDGNAAANLLRAAQSQTPPADRSQVEPVGKADETKAQARRRRGLATRRAGRSKS